MAHVSGMHTVDTPFKYFAVMSCVILSMTFLVYFFWQLGIDAYTTKDIKQFIIPVAGGLLFLWIAYVCAFPPAKVGNKLFSVILLVMAMAVLIGTGLVAIEQHHQDMEEQRQLDRVYECMLTFPRSKQCEKVLYDDMLKDKVRYEPSILERGFVRVASWFE